MEALAIMYEIMMFSFVTIWTNQTHCKALRSNTVARFVSILYLNYISIRISLLHAQWHTILSLSSSWLQLLLLIIPYTPLFIISRTRFDYFLFSLQIDWHVRVNNLWIQITARAHVSHSVASP